ncbi:MAG: hypothetical protein SNH88_06940 [Rikenellaceae bacterium]
MKRLTIATLMIFGTIFISAAEDHVELLRESLKKLGDSYSVDLKLNMQGHEFDGGYAISGDSYYMQIGERQEYYGDKSIRYEVTHALMEVVVDTPPKSPITLMDDPVNAFANLYEQFESEMSGSTLILTSKDQDGLIVSIELTPKENLPRVISYEMDGERVSIELGRFRQTNGKIKKFEKRDYPEFEIIDLR